MTVTIILCVSKFFKILSKFFDVILFVKYMFLSEIKSQTSFEQKHYLNAHIVQLYCDNDCKITGVVFEVFML